MIDSDNRYEVAWIPLVRICVLPHYLGSVVVPMKHWARMSVYNPFSFGPCWTFVRFEVEGKAATLKGGFKGFVTFNPTKKMWWVYEKVTGGYLGEGKDVRSALRVARKNIQDTPNFSTQVQKLGNVMNLPIHDTEEAWKKLSKGNNS